MRGTIPGVSPADRPIHPPAAAIDHYENFPVASWLCPPTLRAPIAAIYHFARSADDIADEGSAGTGQRLAELDAYHAELRAIAQGRDPGALRPEVFGPLARALREHHVPTRLLHDLLDAFEQDVRYSDSGQRYRDDTELLDYCRRSANPIGRLLLHLYRIDDPALLQHSDQICSALQLINFWQDLGQDLARGRCYPSLETMHRFGVREADLLRPDGTPGARQLVAHYAAEARRMMHHGAVLALRIPGRAGWELRLVVQGGLRILDKIEACGFATWRQRPRLRAWDLPLLLWRAWRMASAMQDGPSIHDNHPAA